MGKRRDSTHWLTEAEVTRLLGIVGPEGGADQRSQIRHITVGGERRWNFWDVQDWLDEQTRLEGLGG